MDCAVEPKTTKQSTVWINFPLEVSLAVHFLANFRARSVNQVSVALALKMLTRLSLILPTQVWNALFRGSSPNDRQLLQSLCERGVQQGKNSCPEIGDYVTVPCGEDLISHRIKKGCLFRTKAPATTAAAAAAAAESTTTIINDGKHLPPILLGVLNRAPLFYNLTPAAVPRDYHLGVLMAGHLDVLNTMMMLPSEQETRKSSYNMTTTTTTTTTTSQLVTCFSRMKCFNGWTPFHVAAWSGQYSMLKLLQRHRVRMAPYNPTIFASPVFIAASAGHCETITTLHSMGVGINVANNAGTPVFAAAQTGEVEAIKTLHQLGADLNAARIDGWSPATAAAYYGQIDAIKVLHALGADMEGSLSTSNSWNPMIAAAGQNQVAVIRLLHSFGVDVNTTISNGYTPVFIAAQEGWHESISVLHELGADINKADNVGITPIHIAAWEGQLRTVQVLFSLGADFRTPKNDGTTPLHTAAKSGHETVVEYLHELSRVPPQNSRSPPSRGRILSNS